MTIAEKIVKVRHDSGLSEEDFAKKLDISEAVLKKYESGELVPDDDLRVKISTEFSLPPDELYLEESEQQALNAQTELTIDQKLPYNPYVQQLPQPPYTPPVQKDKLFKSAALKIIAYPYLWIMAIGVPISITMIFVSMALDLKGEDISYGTSMVTPVIVSSILIFFTYILIFLISKKQYFKAFNMVDKENIVKKYFPIFILSNLFVPNMVSSVFTDISDFVLKVSGNYPLSDSANELLSLIPFSSVKTFLSCIVSIAVQYIVLKNMFLCIDSFSDEISRNRTQKKTLKIFTALTVIFAVAYIINICFFTSFSVAFVFDIISMLLYISLPFLWFKLYKTPEIENNKAFMKIVPYTITIVQFAVLLTIVFLSVA